MKRFQTILLVIGLAALAGLPAAAQTIDQSQTVGPYRIELQVLPPEPFYTASQVASQAATSGMLITGGAAAVQPNGPAHPNHHLIVLVFDNPSGKAETNVTVRLQVRPLSAAGQPVGPAETVPVVVMSLIGMGPTSTHYGNNLYLKPGSYSVTAWVNGETARFKIAL